MPRALRRNENVPRSRALAARRGGICRGGPAPGQTTPGPGQGVPCGACVPIWIAMRSGTWPVTSHFPVVPAVPAAIGGLRPYLQCRRSRREEKPDAQVRDAGARRRRHIRHMQRQTWRGARANPWEKGEKRPPRGATLFTRYPCPALPPQAHDRSPLGNPECLSAYGTRATRGRCESSPASCRPCCRPASRRGRPARRWHARSGNHSRS